MEWLCTWQIQFEYEARIPALFTHMNATEYMNTHWTQPTRRSQHLLFYSTPKKVMNKTDLYIQNLRASNKLYAFFTKFTQTFDV